MINPRYLLLLLAFSLPAYADDDVEIEDWRFVWTVKQVEDAEFSIVKDDDSLYCVVSSDTSSVHCSPNEAEAIAAALNAADDELDKLKKAGGDQSKTVEVAGDYKITYSYAPDRGGYVSIREDGIFSRTLLEPKEARGLGKAMANAKKLAKIVEDRIKP